MFPNTRQIGDDTIILRQGEVDNDADGTPLLINFKGEAYRVNDTAVSLWNMCNGISFQDLFYEVMRISNDDEANVKSSLFEMIIQLNDVSVIKLKKVKSNATISR
jgi:hypothetical protein